MEAKRINEKIIDASYAIAAGDIGEDEGVEVVYDEELEEAVEAAPTDPPLAGLKTTGLEEEAPVKRKPGRPKNSKNKLPKKNEQSDLLQALIVTERMAAKREARREKLHDKRDKRNTKMMFGMMGFALNMFAKKKYDEVDLIAMQKMFDSDSEEESLSSINTDDSPPTKRLKRKHQDTMEKRNQEEQQSKKKKRKRDSDSDDSISS